MAKRTEQEIAASAADEVAALRHWRAKEILIGAMPRPYSPFLAEEIGKVMLAMHDTLAAGRYLFLSGVRRPEYEAAIGLWLDRHRKGGHRRLYDNFFKQARLKRLEDYPPAVRKTLEELGADEESYVGGLVLPGPLVIAGFLIKSLLLLSLLGCFLVGVFTVFERLSAFLRGL